MQEITENIKTQMTKSFLSSMPLLLLFIGLVSVILFLSDLIVLRYNRHIKEIVYNELSVIADLKVASIGNWKQKHISAARILTRHKRFANIVKKSFQYPVSVDEINESAYLLEYLNKNYGVEITVYNLEGRKLFSYPEKTLPVDFLWHKKQIEEVLKTKDVLFVDFHRHSEQGSPSIGYLIPIYAVDKKTEVMAIAYLKENPSDYLYPLLQSWPTPSKSAETLLFRKEGGAVLYLNELRHKKNTALSFKMPIAQKNVIAVQALSKGDGVFEGVDYRGIESLAVTRKVPGTEWIMVSKVDKAEVFSALKIFNRTILTSAVFAIFMCFAGLLFFLRRHNSNVLKRSNQQLRAVNQQLNISNQQLYAETTERKKAEAELKKNQELLSQAEKTGKVGGWEFDIKTKVQTWTDMVYEIHELDISDRQTVDQGINYYTPESRPVIERAVKRAVELGEPFDLELEIVTAKGNLRSVHTIGKTDLERKKVFGFFQDITERKRAEKALLDSENQLKMITDNIPPFIAYADSDLIYRFINKPYEDLFGLTRNEIIGKHVRDVLGEEYYNKNHETMLKVLAGDKLTFEAKLKTKNGKEVDLTVSYIPSLDSKGNVKGLYVFANDITLRKQMEERLIESERMLNEAQKMAQLGNWTWDMKTQNLIWSDEVYAIFGKRPGEFKPSVQAFESAIHPEDLKDFLSKREKMMNEKKYACIDHRIVLPTGEIRFVQERTRLIIDEKGEVIRVIGTVQDITERKRAEETIQASKERFQSLFDNMSEGVALHELVYKEERPVEYRIVDVNRSFFKILEIPRESVAGKLSMEAYGTKTPPYFEKYVEVALNKKPCQFETYFAPLNKYFAISVAPWEENGFTTIFTDITERKLVEEALKVSEVRYRRLFETAKDGIIILDAYTGMIVDVNPFLVEMLGLTHDEFCSKKIWEIGLFKDILANEEKFMELQQKGYIRYEDMPLETIDGRHINVEFVSNVYEVNNKKVIQCNIRDITKRKHAEEKLFESERLYRELTENINDAIFTIDVEGVVMYISLPIKQCAGYMPQELIGKKFSEFIHPDDLPGLQKSWRETIENRLEPWEFRYRSKDGKIRWARTSSKPILEGRHLKGIRGVFSDITEHKHLEEELIRAHKLDSLGVLAGGIAHDYNNILTGILGNISMVREGMPQTDKSSEILIEAEKAVFQAKNLTQQLLTFAKGGAPVKKIRILADILKESALFACRGTKTKCEFYLDPSMHLVNIDQGQISQVVSNIVINAVQATPQGGTITVSSENISLSEQSQIPVKAGEYVRFIINDTGTGIPREHLSKIFDPYFTTKQQGSGLGLATCYSIIKNHDGYITVESELGKGSSFIVYLPAYLGTYDTELAKGIEVTKGSGRILVMDDEKLIRDVAERILNKLGYTVETVGDGDQAIELYKKTFGTSLAFDAVILDLTIAGGKGGKDTIKELKSINPEIKSVVSSGYSSDQIMSDYRESGFTAILPKPYKIEEISEVLHNLLNKKT